MNERVCSLCGSGMDLIADRIGMIDLGENPCMRVRRWQCRGHESTGCRLQYVDEIPDERARAAVQRTVDRNNYYLDKP